MLRQRGRVVPELIAVTGYGQAADTRRALEAGFRFHLVKPVDARDLDGGHRPLRDRRDRATTPRRAPDPSGTFMVA